MTIKTLYEKYIKININNEITKLNNNNEKTKNLISKTNNNNQNNLGNIPKRISIISNGHSQINLKNKKNILELFDFCKFLFIYLFGCLQKNSNEEYSKYVDLKKEALSEEFIYSLYFEKKHDEIEKFMKGKNNISNTNKNESCNLEQNTSNISNIPIHGEDKPFEIKYQNYII